jgi:hypothetical protein
LNASAATKMLHATFVRASLLEVLIVRQQLPFERSSNQTRLHLHAIQRQLDALPPDQRCLFNSARSLKPVLSFDLGLHAELTGEAESAASYFSETIRLLARTKISTS